MSNNQVYDSHWHNTTKAGNFAAGCKCYCCKNYDTLKDGVIKLDPCARRYYPKVKIV